MAPLQIYHKEITRSIRVVWLCEELALPYRLISVDKGADTNLLAEFRRLSIFSKVPVLVDGDVHLSESGAIMQYLLEKWPESAVNRKAGSQGRVRFLQWLHGAETLSFAASLVAQHGFLRPEDQRIAVMAEEGRAMARSFFAALEEYLSERQYLVDDAFSAADIMVGYTLCISALMTLLKRSETPRLAAYYDRITAREAFGSTMRACMAAENWPLTIVA